jgi:Leucine-rich repeat (LRR) protein
MIITIKYQNNNNKYKYNSFTQIPNYDKVVYINCTFNKLTSLPELPKLLKTLECSQNQLTLLPEVPKLLQQLGCEYNQLKSLPELPINLTELEYSNYKIKQKHKYLNKLE